MADQIDEFDWAQSPLGPRAEWPATLRLMVGVALRTRFPMLVFWGRDLVQIYNDAFVPILGARHPAALGQFARDCWPEIWDTIGPLLRETFEAGVPAWGEDMPLVLERNGYPEQTHFTFSYSRIGDEDEEGGVLCTCVETTKSVLRETEFRAMADHIADIVYTHAPDGPWCGRIHVGSSTRGYLRISRGVPSVGVTFCRGRISQRSPAFLSTP